MKGRQGAGRRPHRLFLGGSEGVVPVEVKSGRRVKATSAARFADKYGCPYIIRLSTKNFGSEGNVRSVPLYAACLVTVR